MTSLDDTIVACATPPGPGGRAIVRLSGPSARATLAGIVPDLPEGRGVFPVSLRLPDLHSPVSADIYSMPAPHSYTGQDCFEVHLISSPPIVEHLIATLLTSGARAAGPGEFTMRAFLSGKKDLTQAEAVFAVIEAQSHAELTEALGHLAGGVAKPLHSLRDDLLNLLADIEAGLDFIEEDIEFVGKKDALLRLGAGMAQLINLQRQLTDRNVSDRPFRVAIVGDPNAGKSSLFNALAGSASALVSPVAGTTRDYVTRSVTLEGTRIELIDTAGWQSASNDIEAQAQRLGREQANKADLVLHCVAADVVAEETAGNFPQHSTAELVVTKVDLVDRPFPHIVTSVRTGHGIAELRRLLSERARSSRSPALAPSLSRCQGHVTKSLTHLRSAHRIVLFDEPLELMALELRSGLDQIGEMVGAIYTDDLLDRIFSRFCIGK